MTRYGFIRWKKKVSSNWPIYVFFLSVNLTYVFFQVSVVSRCIPRLYHRPSGSSSQCKSKIERNFGLVNIFFFFADLYSFWNCINIFSRWCIAHRVPRLIQFIIFQKPKNITSSGDSWYLIILRRTKWKNEKRSRHKFFILKLNSAGNFITIIIINYKILTKS